MSYFDKFTCESRLFWLIIGNLPFLKLSSAVVTLTTESVIGLKIEFNILITFYEKKNYL